MDQHWNEPSDALDQFLRTMPGPAPLASVEAACLETVPTRPSLARRLGGALRQPWGWARLAAGMAAVAFGLWIVNAFHGDVVAQTLEALANVRTVYRVVQTPEARSQEWLDGGMRYRLERQSPEQFTLLVDDGSSAYRFESRQNLVIIGPSQISANGPAILEECRGESRLKEMLVRRNLEVQKLILDGRSLQCISEPTPDQQVVRRRTTCVDTETKRIVLEEDRDSAGQLTRVAYFHYPLSMDPKLFQFETPPGAKVVRESQPSLAVPQP